MMDGSHFDHVVRSLSGSRRWLLSGALALGAGWLGVSEVDAKKKRKPKRPKPNGFGCLKVDAACKTAGQCCSGVCAGNQSNRKCAAHNAGICRPDGDFCLGAPQACKLLGERIAVCWLTTGKGSFCGDPGGEGPEAFCRDCNRDPDCQEEFGPGAACIDMRRGICADQGACADTGGTACMAAVV
jgi:hypothetical protein